MRPAINIHPLDLNRDIKVGVLLNLSGPNGKVFQSSYTTIEQAKSNIINLIFTNEGERIMQPKFGCSIKKLLFEPLDGSLIKKMDARIRDKMAYWLPYVKIHKLLIEGMPNLNRVDFEMEFSMKGNDFDRSTVTFNFDIP